MPRNQRGDIQGLRALAVTLVIVYHLYPQVLPGGFVGVDAFFVISGYLIIGSLVREVSRSGKITLGVFYARRIRRLLPAATTVLIGTLIATVILLPQGRWQSIARDGVMSALQLQNWNQAFGASSYEGATAQVSPLQHYWSLAVEEQFYLVIPLLLLGAAACARLLRRGKTGLSLWLVCLVSVASFAHSMVFTLTNHEMAYFATTTRMWELGLGGIGALVMPRLRLTAVISRILGWLGLGLIVFSALTFSTSLAFPGFIALVPVVGTMFIISSASANAHACSPAWSTVSAWLSIRPMTFVGDISYSLYLWHWPVVVFYVFKLGRTPELGDGAVIVAISVVLAMLTHRSIEERFRHGRPVRQPDGRRFNAMVSSRAAYASAVCLVAATSFTAAIPWVVVQIKFDQLSGGANKNDYPGAMAFAPFQPAFSPPDMPVKPDPSIALQDHPLTSRNDCGVYDPASTPDDECYYGDLKAGRTAILVGDSHAGQFVDPVAELGSRFGWEVRAMVRNGCPFSAAPPSSGTTVYWNCSNQNAISLQKILLLKPKMVIISGMTSYGYQQALHWRWAHETDLVNGYASLMRPLVDAGIAVRVILDIPYPDFAAPDCVQVNGPASDRCQIHLPDGQPRSDALRSAAELVPGVKVLDLTSYFCRDGLCPAVIGNVLVYRDNHMTNTFAKTLAEPLQAALDF